MERNHAIIMILNILSETKNNMLDDDLLENLLSFLISLIEGCNINIQKSIYNYFINIPSSEFIIEKFYNILEVEIKFLKGKNDFQKREGNNEKINLNKNSNKSIILEKVLKILKHFTEGHFLDLQNYLRQQMNSRINYDLVSQVIELLHAYHFDINEYNYDSVLLCLKTLNEFIQVIRIIY